MYDTNVLGVHAHDPGCSWQLVASGDGHVISIGSIAAIETYAGGAGLQRGQARQPGGHGRAALELLGQPGPGLGDRSGHGGDRVLPRPLRRRRRAGPPKVYEGLTPLSADDVAEIVVFVASRPSHVDIDQLVIRPRDQARSWAVNREG